MNTTSGLIIKRIINRINKEVDDDVVFLLMRKIYIYVFVCVKLKYQKIT